MFRLVGLGHQTPPESCPTTNEENGLAIKEGTRGWRVTVVSGGRLVWRDDAEVRQLCCWTSRLPCHAGARLLAVVVLAAPRVLVRIADQLGWSCVCTRPKQVWLIP